jgi:hypothetical protein
MAKVANNFELYQTSDLQSVFQQCEFTKSNRFMTGFWRIRTWGKQQP